MRRNSMIFVLVIFVLTAKAQDFEMRPAFVQGSPIGFLGIAQDKYGYIWLSDNGNGLYKYDGKNTVVYRSEPANPNSLASNRIENVVIDSDGMLWLVYFDAGISRFDSETETFTHFKHDPQDPSSLCSNGTRDIVEDLNGDFWIGTNAGLDKFDQNTGEFVHNFSDDPEAEILRNEHVRKLYVDRAGIIWIGTGSAFFGEETEGGLFSLNPNTGEVNVYRHTDNEHSLIDNRVRGIFEDSRGVFWVGTAGDGLHTMDRENGTFTRHLFDPQNPKKLSRPAVRNDFSFGVDHITFIGEDDEGGIWIGTFENGINHYNPQSKIINHFGVNESGVYKIENARYWNVLKSREGSLWFMPFARRSGSSPLYKLNITSNRLKFYENDRTSAIAQALDSTIYLGTEQGVQVLRNSELEYLFKTYAQSNLDPRRVRDIKFDSKGDIWATTAGAGLFQYNLLNKEVKNYRNEKDNPNSLSSDYLGTIFLDKSGEVFIATNDGVDIFNPEDHVFSHFKLTLSSLENLDPVHPRILTIDQQKRVWVAGAGGIYQFDREKNQFRKYELGLGAEIVRSVYEDVDGHIWISTVNHGLRRFDDGENTFQSVLDETRFLSEYSNVRVVTQDKNKSLWFGTFSGLVKYDIETNQGTLFGNDWISEMGRGWNGYCATTLYSGEIMIGFGQGYYRFQPNRFIRKESDIQKPFIQKLFIGNKALSPADNGKKYNAFRENSVLELSHTQNSLSFEIGYIDYINNLPSQPISFKLENYDLRWRTASSGYLATYSQLPPGKFALLLKAQDSFGNWGEKQLSIVIAPPWWQTWWAYVLYGLLFVGCVLLIDRIQRKRLLVLERARAKDRELEQAREIEKAYHQLKTAQTQLIQAEKMASLGELTAGIAHEIQNPLNFVNNFSEVSGELLDEVSNEIEQGNTRDVKEIISDLKLNLEKITLHGKRADSIVKGMLQHSRTSSGKKEATDINNLCDEYLRLAFHGMRAKDKSFNASFETDFDPGIPKVRIVPQDMGRVLLNLINNAFHAVDEKAQTSGDENYKPGVKVITEIHPLTPPSDQASRAGASGGQEGLSPSGGGARGGGVTITISDNGPGIPDEIKEKIFQPFFTTKPTGEGTGLGLSLSYDIVKAHGGTLKVNSEMGRGTDFQVILPINPLSN